jgi:hypothetical protein
VYRIPGDLDLSPIVGDFITQFRVGAFDIQFSIGNFSFSIFLTIKIYKGGELLGQWISGNWPESVFYSLFNERISDWRRVNDRLLVISFMNGIEMHLADDSEENESMTISAEEKYWII